MSFSVGKQNLYPYSEWLILQMIFELQQTNEIIEKISKEEYVLKALGIFQPKKQRKDFFTIKSILEKRYLFLKKNGYQHNEQVKILESNIQQLSQFFCLSHLESAILRVSVYTAIDSILKAVSDMVSIKYDRRIGCDALAHLLRVKGKDIVRSLKEESSLCRFQLISYTGSRLSFGGDLTSLTEWDNLFDIHSLDSELVNFDHWLVKCVHRPNIVSDLALDKDFAHISEMTKGLLHYLSYVNETKKKGSNILIYGAAGTGKSEFATLLVQQLNMSAYFVNTANENGEHISAGLRLNNLCLAQHMMNGHRNVIIFDEVEDVFQDSALQHSLGQSHKGWINESLEHNSVPVIWISNNVRDMDVAFIRRFDVVLEMPDLPLDNKRKLIQRMAPEQLPTEDINHLAKQKEITPAMLQRSFAVAKVMCPHNDYYSQYVYDLLNQTLKARGEREIIPLAATRDEHICAYSLDWIACDTNLRKLTDGLRQRPKARICCYGPPGTGKTAWAKWLGEQLNMPVLVKRASDLLDHYVGKTEQNIARVFEQARHSKSILVLDEVDGFLYHRETATHQWERTMVNEMLTQLERFDGVFVASTNLMGDIDAAALRRFDIKLKFNYLKPEQVLAIAQQQLLLWQWPELEGGQVSRLQAIKGLTPGDFAAAARQHIFSPFESVDEWFGALEQESALKKVEPKKAIGFI